MLDIDLSKSWDLEKEIQKDFHQWHSPKGRFSAYLALNCIKPSPAPHLLMFHHISPVLKRWIEMLLRVRFSRFDRTNSIIFTTHNKTEKNLPMIDWKDLACTTPPFPSLSLSLSLTHTHTLTLSLLHALSRTSYPEAKV